MCLCLFAAGIGSFLPFQAKVVFEVLPVDVLDGGVGNTKAVG